MQSILSIQYDEGKFFVSLPDDIQEQADFNHIDSLANGFMWSMLIRSKGQRKMHPYGPVCKSVWPMLDYVKMHLGNDPAMKVRVLCPDVQIDFYV